MVALFYLSSFLSLTQVETQAAFDKRLEKQFVASGVPGAAVRVAIKGKVVYQRAFGFSNEETKAPMKVSDSFEIGSLSKQFTSVSALMLVQEGKLSLSEKIGAIIPEIPESWRSATIDQVMHHMSGIPDYEEIATYDFYNAPRTSAEVITQGAKKEPAFKPGDKFDYSNTGYYLISMVVERRSGMPMSQFLRRKVFDKLGMKSTYAEPATSKLVTGYHSRTGKRVAQPPIAWSSSMGAGAIVSTLDDLMKWDEGLYTEKLLRKDLLEKIWTPTKLNDGSENSYGYGWFATNFRGIKELNHSGQTNGFTCLYRRFPDQHCSVWAFTNTYGGDVVFNLVRPAVVRFIAPVSYPRLPIPIDPDPARTKRHILALTQAANGGEDLSLLAPNMKSFATEEKSEPNRKFVKQYMAVSPEFRFVRMTKRTSPTYGEVEDFLYRQTNPEGDKYWTLGFANGLMVSVRMEDE